MNIVFTKPYATGKELEYIQDVIQSGKISGDGNYTKKCHSFFQQRYAFQKCLLTTSCTDALEMAALLFNIQPGDEVIMPSYTFVSTANAFVLRGAKIVFCDSRKDHPGMDESQIESLITNKTKAIVPVHYAGVACDMHIIMQLAGKYNLLVVEDAAQGIDSYYTFPDGTVKPLGGIGHLAAFSFHETKNIHCGEGGMLVINDPQFNARAEIIREKGTNRSAFFRGEVDKYSWVDIGSSFLPSDIVAAFLYAQLEQLEQIQADRKALWNQYHEQLKALEAKQFIKLPCLPGNTTNNAHMFYIICRTGEERDGLLQHLKQNKIQSVFHYLSLHKSAYYEKFYKNADLHYSDFYSNNLLRLPFWIGLTPETIKNISTIISNYFE
jgi:dTDP-4-amino-4,6-dideoxygalactose transaminase